MNQNNSKKMFRKGFTIVELVIVIAITVALASTAILSLSRYKKKTNVSQEANEIVTVLREAQRKSMAQEDGASWGVRFWNSSSTGHIYELWKGTSYASSGVVKRFTLPNGVEFGEPWGSSTLDIHFNAITGATGGDKVVTVVAKSGSSIITDVLVNETGIITTDTESDMIGYWHFTESTTSTIHDASLQSPVNDQNPPDPLVWRTEAECKFGPCIEFNGYHTNGLTTDRSFKNFTVEAWVKLTQNGLHGGIFSALSSGAESFDARMQSSSRKPELRTNNNHNTTAPAPGLIVGEWYHLAYVYDGEYKRIYINGAQDIADPRPDLEFRMDNYEMGRSEEKTTYLLYGYVDELRVYDRALSAEEVLANYNLLK